MELVYNAIEKEHNNPNHPENHERLKLLELEKDDYVNGRNGERYLELAHSKDYIKRIKDMKRDYLNPDTYLCKKSYDVACYAVGSAMRAMEIEGFSLMRPPGHHAEKDSGGGFCIFNNMAIIAKYVAKKKRISIIDFDAHHGNGTENIVLGDENILYLSTHQSPCYPGTGLNDIANCINIPLKPGIGDEEYIKILEEKVRPALEEFNPDYVGVSAGFDSYYKDYGWLTHMKLTKKSYERICKIISDYKNFFVLEGGYNPESVKEGVECIVKYFK